MATKSPSSRDDSGAAVRAAAARVIFAVLFKRQTVESVLPAIRDSIVVRDQGLLTHLVQGTLRWHTALSALWQPNLTTPIHERDQMLNVLMALGLYQSAIMKQPDYVAVSTVVEASKQLGKRQASGLINAVLRKTCRQLASGERLLIAGVDTHPDWLVEQIRASINDEGVSQATLLANDQPPPIWLRVHPHRFQPTWDKLVSAGIAMQRAQEVPTAVLLSEGASVAQVLAIGGADVAVQDVSAQYLGIILSAYANQLPQQARVLDACAAPGGKTALVAQQFPEWQITAVDKSAQRLSRLRENLARQSVHVEVAQADLLDADSDCLAHHHYDLVILDAPCSGIGVIRRHPDIKHLRVSKAIERVAAQQAQIIRSVWQSLRPGGVLIYITCSYLTAETQTVIRAFVDEAADIKGNAPQMTRTLLPSMIMPTAAHFSNELSQPRDDATFPEPLMDGFYYAVLQKE